MARPVTPSLGMFDGGLFEVFGEGLEGISEAAILLGMERELRWRGQTSEPWPIAMHCMGVSAVVRSRGDNVFEQLAALVHDVEEAILGDVPTPLKRLLRVVMLDGSTIEYEELERRVRARCIRALGLSPAVADLCEGPVVKLADRIVLHAEARVLCHRRMPEWLGAVPEGAESDVSKSVAAVRGALASRLGRDAELAAREWLGRVRQLAAAVARAAA